MQLPNFPNEGCHISFCITIIPELPEKSNILALIFKVSNQPELA